MRLDSILPDTLSRASKDWPCACFRVVFFLLAVLPVPLLFVEGSTTNGPWFSLNASTSDGRRSMSRARGGRVEVPRLNL